MDEEKKIVLKKRRRASKSEEKRVAEILKGVNGEARRLGLLGFEDVISKYAVIEVKGRKVIPKFLTNAYAQTRSEDYPNKIASVLIHKHGDKYENAFVVITFKSFLTLLRNHITTLENKLGGNINVE